MTAASSNACPAAPASISITRMLYLHAHHVHARSRNHDGRRGPHRRQDLESTRQTGARIQVEDSKQPRSNDESRNLRPPAANPPAASRGRNNPRSPPRLQPLGAQAARRSSGAGVRRGPRLKTPSALRRWQVCRAGWPSRTPPPRPRRRAEQAPARHPGGAPGDHAHRGAAVAARLSPSYHFLTLMVGNFSLPTRPLWDEPMRPYLIGYAFVGPSPSCCSCSPCAT